MAVIDARGQACPKPVMMVNDALRQGELELTVHLDDEIAVANVTRLLEGAGFDVASDSDGAYVCLTALRSSAESRNLPGPEGACLILSRTLGSEDLELGEVLMKSFLSTLVSLDSPPGTVALMNGGVKLALAGTSTADTLNSLAERGTDVLVCGACVKHFGVEAQVSAGRISNMLEITELVWGASRSLVIG